MKAIILSIILIFLMMACAPSVRFVQTDESYVITAKPADATIVFRKGKIRRPHKVIGVIEATLWKKARRPELDALLIQKAKEIGADGVMSVEYDIDRSVYIDKHVAIIGRGHRAYAVSARPRVKVEKSASGIAVIFK